MQKIIDRTNGGPVLLKSELHNTNQSRLNLEPQELALANVVKDLTNFPATNWFIDLLKKGVMRYEPSWEMLRKACPPGQPKKLRPDAANLTWLVMNLQQKEPDLFEAWVEHIKMALPADC